MKFKEVTVKEYNFWDNFNCYKINEVNLLLDINSTVTRETFHQDRDDYYISSTEVDRILMKIQQENLQPFQEYNGRCHSVPEVRV